MANPRFLLCLLIALSLISSCKKPVEACYTFSKSQYTPTVHFNSECSEGAAAYDWEFGDGSSSIAASPSHTYSTFGSYSVTLRVISKKGEMSTTTQTIVIENPCTTCECVIPTGELIYEEEFCGTPQEVEDFCNNCLESTSFFEDCSCN